MRIFGTQILHHSGKRNNLPSPFSFRIPRHTPFFPSSLKYNHSSKLWVGRKKREERWRKHRCKTTSVFPSRETRITRGGDKARNDGFWWMMARQPNETRVRTKLGSLTLGVVRKGIKRVSTRRVFLPRRLSSVVFLATRHFPSADNTHPSPRPPFTGETSGKNIIGHSFHRGS